MILASSDYCVGNLFSHNLLKQSDLQILGVFCLNYLDFLHTELRKAEI